jgi:hypothetical protein
VVSR